MSANISSNEPIVANRKKPIVAIVKIGNLTPVKVALEANSEECATVGQHAAYLQVMINQNHGKKIGIRLVDFQVSLYAIFLEDIALFNYNDKLDSESKYTFCFELEATNNGFEEQQPSDQSNMLKEQIKKLEVQMGQVIAKQDEEKQIREFADLIVVPYPTKLSGNYNREKLLQLIQHGNSITAQLYIQSNQRCADEGLFENILDLLENSKEPGKMIGEVAVEHYSSGFTWPLKLEELELSQNSSYVEHLVYNKMSTTPTKMGPLRFVEYKFSNRCFLFIVEIYYYNNDVAIFNKSIVKFSYRRRVPQ